jgi:4-amino-4-deoxy-L-arabinose transferase-like glycosyltransferase
MLPLSRTDKKLLVGLSLVAVLLVATIVPGPFTIDEASYLVTTLGLRAGRLTVPGTEDLPPSPELRYFDPNLRFHAVETTPVASDAPPLYAFISLPLLPLGWRGLAAINVLAFVCAAFLVFDATRRFAARPETPWVALIAFALGSYVIEYAQGLWPHVLAVATTFGAICLASYARLAGKWQIALGGGLLAGLAVGLRYQNIALASAVALSLLVWSHRRRGRLAASFALGLLLPLIACSWLNHARLGSWNPISKGPGYLILARAGQIDPYPRLRARAASFVPGVTIDDALEAFVVRVVDYSRHPALSSAERALQPFLKRHEPSGAMLVGSTPKKAWLQSCPWALISVLFLAGAWTRRRALSERHRDELKMMSLFVFSVLALFSVAGLSRSDGLAFNQRYFLELLPIVAVALAWSVDDVRWGFRNVGIGIGIGAVVLVFTFSGNDSTRIHALMKAPLLIAVVAAIVWLLGRFGHARVAVGGAVAMSLTWAAGVHLVEDLAASRRIRGANARLSEQAESALPDRSALFAYWGFKDAFIPLTLDRDLVILDVWADEGASASGLVESLLKKGRRVFVRMDGMPRSVLDSMTTGFAVQGVPTRRPDDMEDAITLLELTTVPDAPLEGR